MNAESATQRNARTLLVGTVASNKSAKSITVVREYSIKHKKYGKYIKRRTKVHAHDEEQQAQIGDTVEIMECRPVSKLKHWRLVRVIKKAEA